MKGFTLDDERLKGRDRLADYFDELLARIREIRASERRVNQRIREIFGEDAGSRQEEGVAPQGTFIGKEGQRVMTAWKSLNVTGDATILSRPKVALFCSVKCPGKLILETYDLAKRFRNEGVLVISGFHSPMEQECLRILLRSPHPVIWCLARGMYRRLPNAPVDCRPAVDDGRLVIVSPFPEKVRHVTAKTAMIRNRLVADMADAVVVAHATGGGKMDTLCRDILASGKPLYTFDHPANTVLMGSGAKPVSELQILA